ncbi:hypothetical protein WICPIJ_001371 [Wickerhamomyces pijperi]|uniref:Wbp11/ELF5/Saf1 N-terminal domain-containing protein n=1 Tax=Wickerhamomyces pijperi TaxID=599730 RepID=A0A9P8QE34_WICPI|nr:hypothetical protein WICPIJ_001371 [Wickerhamomyces pijperi]
MLSSQNPQDTPVVPSDSSRKKSKTKQQRQAKLQRQQDRETRLSQSDPSYLRHRIDTLLHRKSTSHNGKLNTKDEKTLIELQNDWTYLEKKGKIPSSLLAREEDQSREETTTNQLTTQPEPEVKPQIKLGRDSIFFDPQWNPLGLAPKSSLGLANIKFDPKKHSHDQRPQQALNIPLPETPQPKYYKLKEYSAIMESDEVLREGISSADKTVKRSASEQHSLPFVPRAVVKKRKLDE